MGAGAAKLCAMTATVTLEGTRPLVTDDET